MLAMTPALLLSDIDVPAALRAAPAWQLGLLWALVAPGTCGHLCLILAMGLAGHGGDCHQWRVDGVAERARRRAAAPTDTCHRRRPD